MHKQLEVTKEDDLYRVVCRDFMGRYEGESIGGRLGLTQVTAPEPGEGTNGLKPGQYYMWQVMSRHPELHALIAADKLEELARLARDFHMRVTGGAELLPEVAPPPPKLTPHHRESAIEVIEERHQSVFQRGPKAIFNAFLMRAVPGIIALGLLFILTRHIGDHHQIVPLSTIFARAERPVAEQSFFASIVDPDHSDQVRFEIRGVKFLDGNRMIFHDGHFVAVSGVNDLRPLFDAARRQAVAPVLDARIEGNTVRIEHLRVGDEIFAAGGTLEKLARFGPSEEAPHRSIHPNPNVFQQLKELPAFDDKEAVEDLVGRRIAVVGPVVAENGKRVLRHDSGAGIVLRPVRAQPVVELLDAFTGSGTEFQVDMVLEEVYPWSSRTDPSRARGTTKILGEAEVYSLSAQSFTQVARR